MTMSFETTHAMQERIRCACPRLDARDCIERRNGRDLRRLIDGDDRPEAEECECACHEPDEDEDP